MWVQAGQCGGWALEVPSSAVRRGQQASRLLDTGSLGGGWAWAQSYHLGLTIRALALGWLRGILANQLPGGKNKEKETKIKVCFAAFPGLNAHTPAGFKLLVVSGQQNLAVQQPAVARWPGTLLGGLQGREGWRGSGVRGPRN